MLVVADRDDAAVIRESAVDQLRGQHHRTDGEADLGLRQFDLHFAVVVFDQALHFADGLARHDHARHAVGAGRRVEIDLREAVAVGCDRAQLELLAAADGVQVDAVEVVARLFGRDRELRLVDQPLAGRRRRA